MARQHEPDAHAEAKAREARERETEAARREASSKRAEHEVSSGATSRAVALLELCGPAFAVSALTTDEYLTGQIEGRALHIEVEAGSARLVFGRLTSTPHVILAYSIPDFLRGTIEDPSWSTSDDVLRALGIDPRKTKTRIDWLLETCGPPVLPNGMDPAAVQQAVREGRAMRIEVFTDHGNAMRTQLWFASSSDTSYPDLAFTVPVPTYLREKLERREWDGFDGVLRAVGVTPPKPTIAALIRAAGRPEPAAWQLGDRIAVAVRERRAMRSWIRSTASFERIDAGLSIVLDEAAVNDVAYVFDAPIPDMLHEIYVPISRDAGDVLKQFGIDPSDPRYPPSRDH